MSFGAVAGVATSLISASMNADASSNAADAIREGNQAATGFNRESFERVRALLAPYVDVGTRANAGQADLIGVNGNDKSAAAIQQLQQGPQFTAARRLGETGILQNASATGGLRGGNVQGAIAQFDEGLLGQIIQQQFGNLGALSTLGENAAVGTGNAAVSTGGANAALAQGSGGANAGGILGAQAGVNGGINGIINAAGVIAGRGAAGGGGGSGGGGDGSLVANPGGYLNYFQ